MLLTNFRAVCLPYCLLLQDCGRYAVLNRKYKPLGFLTGDRIEYGAYPVLLPVRITQRQAAKLSHVGCRDVSQIYLYSDSCVPGSSPEVDKAYFRRLLFLSGLPIADSGPAEERARQLNLKAAAAHEKERRWLAKLLGNQA